MPDIPPLPEMPIPLVGELRYVYDQQFRAWAHDFNRVLAAINERLSGDGDA